MDVVMKMTTSRDVQAAERDAMGLHRWCVLLCRDSTMCYKCDT